MKKRLVELIVPLAAAAVFVLLNLVPFYQTAEQRIYDVLLGVKPPVPERPEVLFLNVDDTAISNVGLWPWSRDLMARGLIRMREFDTAHVTFDIEYVDASPVAVDGRFLSERLPRAISGEFDFVNDAIRSLLFAIADGRIPPADVPDFIDELVGLTDTVRRDIMASVSGVARDNDSLLGQAAAFHGQAYFTVNILGEADPAPYDRETAARLIGLQNVAIEDERPLRIGTDTRPTILPVLSGGSGAGFPNVIVDRDGVRRRVELVARVGDAYYGQLVLAPLLDWLGGPEVIVRRDRIVLRGATLPGADAATDIVVPLTVHGRMLINWPKGTYDESFRHVSYWRLIFDWQMEDRIVALLREMDANGLLFFYDDADSLFGLYDYAQMLEADIMAGDRDWIDEWREARSVFFDVIGDFLDSGAPQEYLAALDDAIRSGQLDADQIDEYRFLADEARSDYETLAAWFADFSENRDVLWQELPGSFVIIGHVGTSTTDIGVNPFDEQYMNVGTHGAVVNTILQQAFLDDTPWWVSVAMMLVLALLLAFVSRDMSPTPSLISGGVTLVVTAAVGVGVFLLTGTHLNLLTPILGVTLSFVTITAIKFIRENKEKNHIRNAFGHYLSADVIKDVISDPSKLQLGGVKKHMTAMFTDVRGFSTISEALKDEPEKLVQLLNLYLTEMSDTVLAERGTIDKYEGDAIICFWGAPVELEDAAVRACRSAVTMKKIEARLNEEVLGSGLAPAELKTRIGINTGEMVVGNMGTATRMDYTMMGHNVNLAARLEGVNKRYGTWILTSEQTYRETGRTFSVRKLDRVRVVGVNEPLRLYEVVDLREEVDKDQALIQKLRGFNSGLTAFENKEWGEAHTHFKRVLTDFPDDGPSIEYEKRCREYMKKPPRADWDGVYTLDTK
ncbi:MAG: adenylate/guanylate cyclase domain-containing protein [Spirochaetaceae bacterium]|nr:MAG: adenylate/guanylate cyclase domain-containing protein [Spirochaetaceae bacterium]